MLSKQELDAALAAERAMYRALSEVQDITRVAECNAGFLTTGERGNRFLKLVLGKAKAL